VTKNSFLKLKVKDKIRWINFLFFYEQRPLRIRFCNTPNIGGALKYCSYYLLTYILLIPYILPVSYFNFISDVN